MNNEAKIKIILAIILAVATLLGLNALVSAVMKAEHNRATHTSSISQQELTLNAETFRET
ncbi:hypothetical protein NB311A_05951 [Nitrobacter sp. Nb-311A]|uniref:hypothetical protein n=1 Tax=unclassified Nitrobacter TaxID=2620411 RepID=UPI00006852AA|nr:MULTISPECIES: hypothetical protein [unclassified Nitrobacter]EAQ34537.1 hypothetical protein NB311A_05951 [Nitrobacter sp. Nb-311A]MCB1392183.1 hypothetical protein [Nitrobacter sp.]MCV0386707.1 hypothetical protein [Nitrobacter sp.]